MISTSSSPFGRWQAGRSTRHIRAAGLHACGRNATLLCDWRVPGKKSGMCDEPICRWCTTSPAKDKDLCRDHAAAYAKWLASRPSQQAGR